MQCVKAGEGIVASNQSVNHYEKAFPDPDAFDTHRKRGFEQALGFGERRRVAEWLARAELEIVFGKSLERY
jgi:fungal nitric oxide reductase